VVVGEFNAGKSAFVNALVDTDALAEGVTPTTARITVVRHGEAVASSVTPDGLAEVVVPADRLLDVLVVDTPGTNAVLREHEAVTTHFVPRADLVLFVTSADRPFTESERQLLSGIRDWGKKLVLVVNKQDILEGDAQVAEVLRFVGDGVRRLLGIEPALFAVSAREARRGRAGDAGAWARSGFDALEAHLEAVLDEGGRLRLKLRNPLGVGRRLAGELIAECASRLDLLREDRETVAEVERHLEQYSTDMHRDFSFRWSDIEKLLVEMERRGHDHFDETIRLTRVIELLDKDRVQASFERSVVADTPQRIERKVEELIDWLVESDFRQWQQVHERLAERRAAHKERMGAQAGTSLPGGFHEQRRRLVDSVGRGAQRVVETYDRAGEAKEMAEKARGAVAASAAIEAGAAGLGALVATVATTAAADVTGLAMAGVLATLGLLVVPHRRRQAKRELREKVTVMREQLGVSLRGAFEDELQRGIDRQRQAIEPYARFVRAESEHLAAARADLDAIDARLGALDARIEAI
nr:dynamin family protein [Vicinamibacterales bacterium]